MSRGHSPLLHARQYVARCFLGFKLIGLELLDLDLEMLLVLLLQFYTVASVLKSGEVVLAFVSCLVLLVTAFLCLLGSSSLMEAGALRCSRCTLADAVGDSPS